MAPQERQPGTPLEKRLFREFYRFSFFKAVNLLERLSPGKKPLGETLRPGQEAVRFSVEPGLSFPPSDISGLKQADEAGPAEMAVTFMGLVGPAGVLPYWYNELAIQRVQQKDSALPAFFDIFHHRLISLFYLAWRKYQFPANYQPGAKDRFSQYLLSLMGLGTSGLAGMIGVPEEPLIFHSGLISRQVPSAHAMEATVGYLTGNPVHIQQFIDRTILIEPVDQTRIGLANSQLGIDAVCGCQAWENQTKFRVHLGPMEFKQFARFLPTGRMLRPIFSLVKYMVGAEYEFDVCLHLKSEEVPPCVLGDEAAGGALLGWSTWIKARGVPLKDNAPLLFQEADL